MIGLDTNTVIFAISGRIPKVRDRLEETLLAKTPIGIPTVVLYELRYGIRKSKKKRAGNLATLAAFLSLGFDLWSFDTADAEEAADIRAVLETSGTPIGPYDTLIAAQARRRGATLVTANESEFARVPGLKTENWS